MSRTTVYIVSDEVEVVEKLKQQMSSFGVNVQNYSPSQWREGLESSVFRTQILTGMPALMTGHNPIERNNVLPFPGAMPTQSVDASKVATMDELEAKAIENAIQQYRGNLTEAAKALGIGRATLYRKVKQYQIDPSMARKKRAA